MTTCFLSLILNIFFVSGGTKDSISFVYAPPPPPTSDPTPEFIETIDTPKPIITEIARPVINTTVNHIVEIYVPTVTNFVQVSPCV